MAAKPAAWWLIETQDLRVVPVPVGQECEDVASAAGFQDWHAHRAADMHALAARIAATVPGATA